MTESNGSPLQERIKVTKQIILDELKKRNDFHPVCTYIQSDYLLEIIEQAEKVVFYEKELDRLYTDRYHTIKTVAELLYFRAYMFTCSYVTAWNNHLDEDEKMGFTYMQVVSYLCNYKRY